MPEGTDFEAMLERLKTNDIVKGKFLSDDGELALIVIALDREIVSERGARFLRMNSSVKGTARYTKSSIYRRRYGNNSSGK